MSEVFDIFNHKPRSVTDRHTLLTELKSLVSSAPDLNRYSGTPEQLSWLAKGHAYLEHWDRTEAIGFKMAGDFLNISLIRVGNINKLMGALHRGIASIELEIQNNAVKEQTVFGAGAVYDFFKGVRNWCQR